MGRIMPLVVALKQGCSLASNQTRYCSNFAQHLEHVCIDPTVTLTLGMHHFDPGMCPFLSQNVKIINKDGVDEKFWPEKGIYIRSGIVVVGKGATVPDNTTI